MDSEGGRKRRIVSRDRLFPAIFVALRHQELARIAVVRPDVLGAGIRLFFWGKRFLDGTSLTFFFLHLDANLKDQKLSLAEGFCHKLAFHFWIRKQPSQRGLSLKM